MCLTLFNTFSFWLTIFFFVASSKLEDCQKKKKKIVSSWFINDVNCFFSSNNAVSSVTSAVSSNAAITTSSINTPSLGLAISAKSTAPSTLKSGVSQATSTAATNATGSVGAGGAANSGNGASNVVQNIPLVGSYIQPAFYQQQPYLHFEDMQLVQPRMTPMTGYYEYANVRNLKLLQAAREIKRSSLLAAYQSWCRCSQWWNRRIELSFRGLSYDGYWWPFRSNWQQLKSSSVAADWLKPAADESSPVCVLLWNKCDAKWIPTVSTNFLCKLKLLLHAEQICFDFYRFLIIANAPDESNWTVC